MDKIIRIILLFGISMIYSCSEEEIILEEIPRPDCETTVIPDNWLSLNFLDVYTFHIPNNQNIIPLSTISDSSFILEHKELGYNIDFGYCDNEGASGVTSCIKLKPFDYKKKINIDFPDSLRVSTQMTDNKARFCYQGETIAVLYWTYDKKSNTYTGPLYGLDPVREEELYYMAYFNAFDKEGFDQIIRIFKTIQSTE